MKMVRNPKFKPSVTPGRPIAKAPDSRIPTNPAPPAGRPTPLAEDLARRALRQRINRPDPLAGARELRQLAGNAANTVSSSVRAIKRSISGD